MKKVLLAALLILALALSMVACGSGNPEAAFDPNSLNDVLAAHGFEEKDFKITEQDKLEINEEINKDGHIILHTAASHEEVEKACYDACKKAAEDGLVRDASSKNPIDYSFSDVEWVRYGYNRNGNFEVLAFSFYYVDQETGITDYQLFWE